MNTRATRARSETRVHKEDLQEFAVSLLVAGGAAPEDARTVAGALVWADLRGRHPQGVSRLPNFIQRLQRKLVNSPAAMRLTRNSPAVSTLDADNGFGHVAGSMATRHAIDLARQYGVGVTAVRRSNLYGAASFFCSIAAEEHCAGFSCTNAVPKVAPVGGVRPVFGTNPLAFGCPTSSGVPILVDLSTSGLAGSVARSITEAGGSLPEGVALDRNGTPTTNPADLAAGCLLPAAGGKGFGLALMVEIFCGILAGAAMSKEVGSMYNTWDKPVNTGHFFIVIDIEKFLPIDQFFERIDLLLTWVKSTAAEGGQVRFPGEIRGDYASEYSGSGIPLPAESAQPLETLARALNVTVPWAESR